MITDLEEEVSVVIKADDYADAEAYGIELLENGELDCEGQICMSCSVEAHSLASHRLRKNIF